MARTIFSLEPKASGPSGPATQILRKRASATARTTPASATTATARTTPASATTATSTAAASKSAISSKYELAQSHTTRYYPNKQSSIQIGMTQFSLLVL